jgi:phenylacetate-CoA ligase
MKARSAVVTSEPNNDLRSRAPGPGFLGKLQSEFIRRALYPAMERRWHPFAKRYFRELRRYEFASPETIEAFQHARLRALLEHASAQVPYYRNLFETSGIRPQDLVSPRKFARVPVLTKAILQEKRDELIAQNRKNGEGLPNASGGSTGKPVQFFQDAEYWDWAYAHQWFVESWWGIRPGDSTASCWGADRDIADWTWKERLWAAIAQRRVCNAFSLTATEMERFAKMLMAWQPRFVIGYASALEMFSRFLLERPELRIRPRAVKTTADVLSQQQRNLIEKAFGCSVYDFYGSREVNNLAAECPGHQGLHVNALTRYIEVVDDDGNALPPGLPGRILVTDLTNYFMPFIRYEIEDIGSWKGKPCTCGRPFPLLEQIWGRTSDFLVTPQGKMIHGECVTHLFYDLPEVAQFQLEQKALGEIHVSFTLRPGVEGNPVERLRARLRDALGANIDFVIHRVGKIDRPPSGKHRFTVSAVRPSWGHTALPPSPLKEVGAQ